MAKVLGHGCYICWYDAAPNRYPQDTIRAILDRSHRRMVPIRRGFVQNVEGDAKTAPLANLVRRHDERALEFYLLILAAASAGDYDVTHHAAVWARALYLGPKGGSTAVSKALARLVGYRLVSRERAGRRTRILLLREDGSGRDYTHPGAAKEGYLQLPHAYWTDEWNRRLKLPAKAVLLIALSLPNDFFLPVERAPEWFGISGDTISAGLWQLRQEGLLDRQRLFKPAPLTPEGFTTESRYTLRAPFGPHPTHPRHAGGVAPTTPLAASVGAP